MCGTFDLNMCDGHLLDLDLLGQSISMQNTREGSVNGVTSVCLQVERLTYR